MDELINLVAEKTGLPEEMAGKAVEVVVGYLKDKLPDPIAGQIDNVLSGKGLPTDVGDVAKGLGGLLGKR